MFYGEEKQDGLGSLISHSVALLTCLVSLLTRALGIFGGFYLAFKNLASLRRLYQEGITR